MNTRLSKLAKPDGLGYAQVYFKLVEMVAKKQRGGMLIEVLVAIAIMVVGLLGIMVLQYKLQQYTQSAIARSQSSNAITDIVEKMRANRLVAISDAAYNTNFAANPTLCNVQGFMSQYNSVTALNTAATPPDLAMAEVQRFRQDIACIMPLGDVRIVTGQAAPATGVACNPALTAAAEDVVTIIIRYDDRKAEPNSDPASANNPLGSTVGTSSPVYRCFTEVVQL